LKVEAGQLAEARIEATNAIQFKGGSSFADVYPSVTEIVSPKVAINSGGDAS
jgi:hypothetical protein